MQRYMRLENWKNALAFSISIQRHGGRARGGVEQCGKAGGQRVLADHGAVGIDHLDSVHAVAPEHGDVPRPATCDLLPCPHTTPIR